MLVAVLTNGCRRFDSSCRRFDHCCRRFEVSPFWRVAVFVVAVMTGTVVPATAGHRWFRGKVALRGRWPLVTGNGHMRHYVKSNTHIRPAYISQHMHNIMKHSGQLQCCIGLQWEMKRTMLKICEQINSIYPQCNAYFKICRSNRRRFEMSPKNIYIKNADNNDTKSWAKHYQKYLDTCSYHIDVFACKIVSLTTLPQTQNLCAT